MIVVCDVNEIWRRKPFAALAGITEVVGVAPADWLVAERKGFAGSEGDLRVLPVSLPLGWATKTARLGQRMLWRRIQAECPDVRAVVVTSPHYLPLLDQLPPGTKAFYYGSDDYRCYDGWGGMAEKEKQMVERVDHAFFVSRALADRALGEYGVGEGKVSVSMNASEDRFMTPSGSLPVDPPEGRFMRPLAGVVGGINERLDFGLLLECANLPALGTLLLVGPVPENPPDALQQLLEHPKCAAVGRQPHDAIHEWFQCLDVGLVPYVATEFNRMCSPMRLFDHLASGAPVVATAACDQAKAFAGRVSVCATAAEFTEALDRRLGEQREWVGGIRWQDRAQGILAVLEGMGCA